MRLSIEKITPTFIYSSAGKHGSQPVDLGLAFTAWLNTKGINSDTLIEAVIKEHPRKFQSPGGIFGSTIEEFRTKFKYRGIQPDQLKVTQIRYESINPVSGDSLIFTCHQQWDLVKCMVNSPPDLQLMTDISLSPLKAKLGIQLIVEPLTGKWSFNSEEGSSDGAELVLKLEGIVRLGGVYQEKADNYRRT